MLYDRVLQEDSSPRRARNCGCWHSTSSIEAKLCAWTSNLKRPEGLLKGRGRRLPLGQRAKPWLHGMQASFSNSLARCCEAEGPHMQRCLSAQPQAFRGCRPLCACSIAAYTYARQWPSQSSMSVHQSQRNSRLVPRPGGASPVSRSRYVVVCAQDRDRNLVQADLYVLVSICLTFQVKASTC